MATARKFNGFHATGGPVVSLLVDGAEVVYLVEFSREGGDPHLDAIVDAMDGSVLELLYHDIQLFDRESTLTWMKKQRDAAKMRARSLALEGKRVEAMMLWRKTFHCSIFEAKAEIERICHE